jgi:hypothetical protein
LQRNLFLSAPTKDGNETLYTITVDRKDGNPVIGLVVRDNDVQVISWPGGENAVTVGHVTLPPYDEAEVDDAYDRAVAALPDKVELIYVTYDDGLTDDQIQSVFDGKTLWDDPHLEEFESDGRATGVDQVIDEYVDTDDLAILAQGNGEKLDGLRYTIEERDESDMYADLARQAGHKWLRYSIDFWATSPWVSGPAEISTDVRDIAERLGIELSENERLLGALVDEGGPGNVFVLWYGAVDELIMACQRVDHEGNPVPQTITWEGPHLLILDGLNGSGHMVDFAGTITLPFHREQLKLDARAAGGYSWSRDVAGLSASRNTTTVTITEQNIKENA